MPGTNLDGQIPPNLSYCLENRDFITANPQKFCEIGTFAIRDSLEKAEAMDLEFAKRMEGFGNVSLSVVWNCLDPDFDPSDRAAVMNQFMTKYLDRFYNHVDPGSNDPDVALMSDEVLRKHKAFCQAWTKKHYRAITPSITAPAEALAGEFYDYMRPSFPANYKLTRMELARVFMRHPDIAPEFASCLHYFMTSIEQTRGGRNASYKQMSAINSSKALSYNRLGNMLSAHGVVLAEVFRSLGNEHDFRFNPLIVDWYGILGQMPQVHRYFEDTSSGPSSRSIKKMKRSAQGQVPPWRFGT